MATQKIMSDVVAFLNSSAAYGQKTIFLRTVAAGADVPFDTLAKIANGSVANPRIETVQKILDYKSTNKKTPKR